MRKKLLALLLMFLCVFSVCGCASVNFSNIIFADGSIAQQFIVTLDKDKLTMAGVSITTVQNDICNYANSYYNQKLNEFTVSNVDPATKLLVISGHTFKAEPKDNYVNIYLKFANIDFYYYFYNHALPDDSEASGIITDHGFYQKDTSVSQTIYYDLQNNSIAKAWLDYFKAKTPLFDFDDCTYNYTYSTPYEKIYSDADVIEYTDYGNYAHTWSFKSKDLTGENATTGGTVTLYTIDIKSPLWYFVAIGATAVLAVVLYIVSVVKDKKAVLKNSNTINVDIK